MLNGSLKIIFLIAIFSTAVFTGSFVRIIEFVGNFNNYVVVFIPLELRFLISLIGIGLLIKIYRSFA